MMIRISRHVQSVPESFGVVKLLIKSGNTGFHTYSEGGDEEAEAGEGSEDGQKHL